MFVKRTIKEVVPSMKAIFDAIRNKQIIELDISNNALPPEVIMTFEAFLKTTHSLKRLYLNNTGLGDVFIIK